MGLRHVGYHDSGVLPATARLPFLQLNQGEKVGS